ncbi:MAG: hypothetical protein AAGD32_03805 [Planctomycetota bacterium]
MPPNANYEALLNFENILDSSGDPIGTSDTLIETFFVQGDLDRDRDVDLFDALVVQRNFGLSDPSVVWSDGDLDGARMSICLMH